MSLRKTEEILNDIKILVASKGFIYALCMIIYEDFHIILEEIHKVDFRARLNKNEVSLLIGFLIQNKIDFSTVNNPLELISLKDKTYQLMDELHFSLMAPFIEKIKNLSEGQTQNVDIRKEMQLFYSGDNMFTESIFYANDGLYDFQYSDFIERKYKYDKQWLLINRKYDIENTKAILENIKKIHRKKSERVNFFSLKEKMPEILEKIKKDYPGEDWEKYINEVKPSFEFYQYINLFFDHEAENEKIDIRRISEKGWRTFYTNLIDLFIFRIDDFDQNLDIRSFLANFSFEDTGEINTKFHQIGDYNVFCSHPIIELENERFFVPITFSLYEACYESPFYWMLQDENYKNKLSENRGKSGEDISFEFLSKVFGTNRTYNSVKIITKKGCDDTDVDVLCILGSKALCVQVKSKKLTQLSRKGSSKQLLIDFKEAVQDAYEQGLKSRIKILEGKSKFFDKTGNQILLSEGIDEVYIMGITSENYPALTHQAHTLLEKKIDQPYPIFLTVFDLELICHYLNNPYDLLYYVRQRISLMDYFKADNEMPFLGYHLENKLWKSKNEFTVIDSDFGGLIDRNYYPFRLGVNLPDNGDKIKNRWKNNDFEELCNLLAKLKEPKVTDVIFTLLDWDGDSRDNITKYIRVIKNQTLNDGKWHNFTLVSSENSEATLGLTYVSWENDNPNELMHHLLNLSIARKYKSKGDVWIGFGSLKNSRNKIDVFVFNKEKWKFDQQLEISSKILLEGKNQGKKINLKKKISRNDKCICGSGLKYKNCCGKTF